MDKNIHNVKITVFANYEEGVERVKEYLKSLFPNTDFNNKKEQITINEEDIEGEDNDMTILTIYTKKHRHLKDFLANLTKNLTEQDKATLIEQAQSRLDHKKRFFIRLDKEELIKKNKYTLTEKGNCFHIKMNIACFPNTDESAIKILRDIFG